VNNYYSVSIDGTITPITNFDGVDLGNTTQMSIWAEPPNWSPNGRFLISAGSEQGDNTPGYTLYVWDNQEKIGYKPCLPKERQIVLPHLTYWPFDGSYVIVTLTFSQAGKYFPKDYILDLNHKIIYELPSNHYKGEFTGLPSGGNNSFLGWVSWELP
jgi:hypothetical protein